MNISTQQRLDALFHRMPVLLGGGPVSASEIDDAEQRVGLPFTSGYRHFIERYGGAVVGSLPIFGLRRAEVMADEDFSVVDATAQVRAEQWPSTADWIIISTDLAGNPIGLTPSGEIWVSDHDAREAYRVAKDFDEFLVQLLNE